MGWGAMMGLGQGLQQAGGMIMDYNKDKMQAKLETEREARAEQRQIAREQREQALYGKSDYEQDGDGVWWQVDYTKGNKVMDRQLAPKSKIDQFTREANRATLEEEVLGYKRDSYKAEAGIAGELAGLKVEGARADIGATRARTRASDASADNSRASANYTRSGKGKALDSLDDARSAGLDKSTLEALFPLRDADGKVVTDDDGNPRIDYVGVEKYIMSPEYQGAKDKTAGAARFRARDSVEQAVIQEGRAKRAASSGLTADEITSYSRTGEANLPKADKADAGEVEAIQKAERNAVKLIDDGKISVEEAASQMEAKGYKRAAARLRARYGN